MKDQRNEEYVNGSRARVMTGWSWGRLQRLAMVGVVKVKALPGCAPLYRRADLEQVGTRRDRPAPTSLTLG
jgi:hypothetical protein